MASLGDNWSVIDNNYFIKYHFFNMSWNVGENLKDYIIQYEPNGGSIAVISKSIIPQELFVFSSSGKRIASKKWPDSPIIGLYWSIDEQLLLLQKSGRIAIYSLQCEYYKYVSMGDKVKNNIVKSFRFFPSLQGVGLMVLTEKDELVFKTNVTKSDSTIKCIDNLKRVSTNNISDWVVFTDVADREVVALIACKSELIRVKYQKEAETLGFGAKWYNSSASIIKLALSLSQKKIAMAMSNGTLWLLKSDLGQTIAEYNFDFKVSEKATVQMEWAGEDFLVLFYDQSLYLMDTSQQSTNIFYLDDPILFPEIDGVRLITAGKHEFIQRVPHELEQLCELGEDCPAAWLFDAQKHLENNSTDAINYLEQVLRKDGQLERAIDVCMEAALHCLEPRWQKTILNAVRLGRSYLPNYRSDRVAEIHNQLTLLNNLKLPFIAMPLTITQLEHLTLPVVLDRLSNRHYFPFVERLCRQLRIPKQHGINRMLEYWAENFITHNENEDVIATKIIERLKNNTDFNYAKIADIACNNKKYVLAEKLLEKEGIIDQQVAVLLKLKKNSLALSRAIESGNNDLISFVVASLNKDMDQQEFVLLLSKYPVAKTIYIEHLAQSGSADYDRSKRDFEEMETNLTTKAENQLKQALKSKSVQSSLSMMISVQDQYRRLSNDFMVQVLDDQKTLIQHQLVTCKDSGVDPSDGVITSLHNYLSFLFDNNLDDKAETLKQKMKVTDRQFYWLRLNSYAKNGLWDNFDNVISRWSRKMPVSYYEIGEMCAEYENEGQVMKYLDRIEPDNRVRLLVKINRFQEAEELAKRIKSDYMIHYVSSMKFKIG